MDPGKPILHKGRMFSQLSLLSKLRAFGVARFQLPILGPAQAMSEGGEAQGGEAQGESGSGPGVQQTQWKPSDLEREFTWVCIGRARPPKDPPYPIGLRCKCGMQTMVQSTNDHCKA